MFNIMNLKLNGVSVYSILLVFIPEGFELEMFPGTQKQGYHLKVTSLKRSSGSRI